jgi:TPR repeat protein
VDLKKAIDCYSKARMMHVPRASNNLGVLYISSRVDSGLGEEQGGRVDRGMKYLEEAKSLGFPQAYFNLGCLYESGMVGEREIREALNCYYQGGLKGDLQSRLKFAYQLMNQTSIVKDQYE